MSSPRENPKQFIAHYRKVTELGSLSPLPAYSTSPSFLLMDIWRIPRLRICSWSSLQCSALHFWGWWPGQSPP